MDCIQFKINGKVYQFKGVSISGTPSIYKILKAINKSKYESEFTKLIRNLNESDFSELSVTNYTEAADSLLGNISLGDLRSIKAKQGIYQSDQLDKILSIMLNNNFNLDQANIRIIKSNDTLPIIYLGNERNLMTITPETSNADLVSAMSYLYIDDQLRESISDFSELFNQVRNTITDQKLISELNLLPDDVNKNKRLLYYLINGQLDNESDIREKINNILSDHWKKTKISEKILKTEAVKELSQLVTLNPRKKAKINDIAFPVSLILEFKEAFNEAYQKNATETSNITDEELIEKLDLDTLLSGAFPYNKAQRKFLSNLPEEFSELVKNLYDPTNHKESDYDKGILQVNSILNKALIESGKLNDTKLKNKFFAPQAKVLFESDLFARSKRKIQFFDNRRRIDSGTLQVKLVSRKINSNKTYLYVDDINKLPKIEKKATRITIHSSEVNSLSLENKEQLLKNLLKNSNISIINLDGNDIDLVNISSSLGLGINIFSDQWKLKSGEYNKEAFLDQFEHIKLKKSVNVPNLPEFKFYSKDSGHNYNFSGQNLNPRIKEGSHIDLVKSGEIASLLISESDRHKPLLAQGLNSTFILNSTDSEDRIKMQVTKKNTLSNYIREDDGFSIGIVYSNGVNKYISINPDSYLNLSTSQIEDLPANAKEIYKSEYKIINGEKFFRIKNNLVKESGITKELSDYYNYFNEDLYEISDKTGYSIQFLKNKFYDKIDKFDTNWVYDIDTNINEPEANLEIENFDSNGLVESLVEDLGIEIKLVDNSKYGKDVKAYVENGVINLVRGSYTKDSMLHELSHLILADLKYKNYDIYQSLLEQVTENDVEKFRKKYPNMTQNDLYEETLITLFAQNFGDKIIKNSSLIDGFEKMNWGEKIKSILRLNRDIQDSIDAIMNTTLQVILQNYNSEYLDLFKNPFKPTRAILMQRLGSFKEDLIETTKLKEIC